MKSDELWLGSDGRLHDIATLEDSEIITNCHMVVDLDKFPRLKLEYIRRGLAGKSEQVVLSPDVVRDGNRDQGQRSD